MVGPLHPRLQWLDLGAAVAEAAEITARKLHKAFKPASGKAYRSRRAGSESPLWNVCAAMLRAELRPKNAKVLLARHLGIPKQRLNDFIVGRTRLPDAEVTLQLLNWLVQKRAGRDPTRQR
jgi:hypothetical protein